jgi:hypothetical protein
LFKLIADDNEKGDARAEHVQDDEYRVDCLPTLATHRKNNVLEVGCILFVRTIGEYDERAQVQQR